MTSNVNQLIRGALTVPPRSWARDLSLALLFLTLAILSRYMLDPFLPDSLPYITFFPALLLTALLCRLPSAIAFAAASALVGAIWMRGEDSVFRAPAIIVYSLAAAVVIALTEGLKDAYKQIEARDVQLELVNGELVHRMRNLFQIANAVVQQSIKTNGNQPDLERSVAGRLQALSGAQSLIAFGAAEVPLRSLIDITLLPLAPENGRLSIKGPRAALPARAVTMLGLVLYELGSNAVKYGAWSEQSGTVCLRWRLEALKLILDWEEHDGPLVAVPAKLGAGNKLIRNAIPDAAVDYRLEKDGARCRIELPV